MGGGGIMIWAKIGYKDKNRLQFINGKMNNQNIYKINFSRNE